jgi:biopolymer transport protein ExbB
MFEWFHQGGIIMYPLLVCSVIGTAIIIDRCWALRRTRIINRELAELMETNLGSPERREEVKARSQGDRSILSALVRTAFDHASLEKHENVEAVQAVARQMVGRMERGLTTLSIVAEISPLFGLLGTCLGMVHLFMDVARHGLGKPEQISHGIFEALITTVTGLAVAIPALVAYLYLRRRIELLTLEMERHTNELLTRLYR